MLIYIDRDRFFYQMNSNFDQVISNQQFQVIYRKKQYSINRNFNGDYFRIIKLAKRKNFGDSGDAVAVRFNLIVTVSLVTGCLLETVLLKSIEVKVVECLEEKSY